MISAKIPIVIQIWPSLSIEDKCCPPGTENWHGFNTAGQGKVKLQNYAEHSKQLHIFNEMSNKFSKYHIYWLSATHLKT